jgi:hypothetical protein
LNKKNYQHIEAWQNWPIEGEHPYVYLEGIVLKRSCAGDVRNVSVLVASGIGEDGFRKVLGIAEGRKEDKTGWCAFLKHLRPETPRPDGRATDHFRCLHGTGGIGYRVSPRGTVAALYSAHLSQCIHCCAKQAHAAGCG